MRFSLKKERVINSVHNHLVPLEMLEVGEWADVIEITGECCCLSRMAEMGLGVGSRLRVIQSGSPCLLQLGESRLSVRGDCTMQILVRPLGRVEHFFGREQALANASG